MRPALLAAGAGIALAGVALIYWFWGPAGVPLYGQVAAAVVIAAGAAVLLAGLGTDKPKMPSVFLSPAEATDHCNLLRTLLSDTYLVPRSKLAAAAEIDPMVERCKKIWREAAEE